jgi:alanine racemase
LLEWEKEGGVAVDTYYRPTWAEISLDAIAHNINAFRKRLPASMKLMAVVKANAYGHGAVEIAEEAVRQGADYLAVAFLDEAMELRHAGITAPILVMGYTPPEALLEAARHQITVTIYTDEVLSSLETMSASFSRPLKVHIKLDTGMGRIGIYDESEAIAFIEKAVAIPNVQVEGLFTHFAKADEKDKSYTQMQHGRMAKIVDQLEAKGITFSWNHAGNSAAAIDCPETSFHMVRIGISLYGMYPSDEVDRSLVDLKPVMSLKTRVVMVKDLPPGSGISYGTIYETKQHETIATLPIGYADGYTRLLSQKAEALVHGFKVPIVGRICMDQCMLNVTGIPNVRIGDEVVLFGQQGEQVIPVDDLAALLGTINYEMTCKISCRVPRVYLRDGAVVKATNRLRH